MSRYKMASRSYTQYKDEFIPTDVKIIYYKNRRFGYIDFQEKPDGWYLWDMQLSKVLQNKGLGSKLLEYVIEEVKKQKGSVLKLFVYTKNPAVNLYKKFGFKVVTEKSNSPRLQMQLGVHHVGARVLRSGRL
jgi:ribosomal protein S18 acetylase RimI-like enzyme